MRTINNGGRREELIDNSILPGCHGLGWLIIMLPLPSEYDAGFVEASSCCYFYLIVVHYEPELEGERKWGKEEGVRYNINTWPWLTTELLLIPNAFDDRPRACVGGVMIVSNDWARCVCSLPCAVGFLCVRAFDWL